MCSTSRIRTRGAGAGACECKDCFADHERDKERGFALIAALMAIWVLAALGILVFTVTTQDVRASSRSVGEKKAFSAAESGIGWLAENFDPTNVNASTLSTPMRIDQNHPTLIDPKSTFTVATPQTPTSGPATLPTPGYSMGGGEVWGQTRHVALVTGRNSNYNSRLDIQVGLGYGPVDLTTIYR